MSILPTPVDVADFFSRNVDNDVGEEKKKADPAINTPYQELAANLKKVVAIPSAEVAADKLLIMIQVVNKSLIPALVMTPYVYLSPSDWMVKSHSEFRAAQRRELKELEDILKANRASPELKTIATDVLNRFEAVLLNLFKIRIPAMPSFYLTENFYDTISVGDATDDLVSKITQCKKYEIRERTRNLIKVLIQWYLYCPLGRPQVYLNDDTWTTTSEKELRAEYRETLLR
eukprot:TRINITY_DN3_c1_g1_i1.p1 TRINITY_DN3_c1_g1~~TRINITY_DN3_c1_g1_i1.p1  ORF type:complete len:231 (+),score=69.76 TRINITY_DN3_c1_g1_i1:139-831(+)